MAAVVGPVTQFTVDIKYAFIHCVSPSICKCATALETRSSSFVRKCALSDGGKSRRAIQLFVGISRGRFEASDRLEIARIHFVAPRCAALEANPEAAMKRKILQDSANLKELR
jgi:hypothetical protein